MTEGPLVCDRCGRKVHDLESLSADVLPVTMICFVCRSELLPGNSCL